MIAIQESRQSGWRAIRERFTSWPSRAAQIFKLVLTAIVINLFYFMVYLPAVIGPPWAELKNAVAMTSIQVATLKSPTLQALDGAQFKPVELPYTECCVPVYLALKLQFDAPKVPEGGLGLLNFHQVDNFIVALNGSILQQDGEMTFGRQTFHGQTRSMIRVPKGLFKPFGNELIYITVRDGFPYTDLQVVKMAPFDDMKEWTQRRSFMLGTMPYITSTITFLVGALALVILWRSQSRQFAFWLMVLAWLLCANILYGLVLDPPFQGIGRMIAFFSINSAISVAMLCFIDAWTNKPLNWLKNIAISTWVAFVVLCVWALNTMPGSDGFDLSARVWTYHSMALGTIIVLRVLWHFLTTREERYVEAAILSIIGVAILLDGLNAFFRIADYHLHLKESSPLLLVVMIAAFIQRNFRLFQSSDALNEHLMIQLKAREADLAASMSALRAQEAETAIESERARIMRDMHDGMGGQLLSLLMQARDPSTPRAELEEAVEMAIADLRLLIDSLDSVGDDLEIALAMFRERIGPRLTGAKVELDWPAHSLHLQRVFSPAEILSIYRILQEAITNALRHGAPSCLKVRQNLQDGALTITIEDDGKGISPDAHAGRGLANMRRRIQDLGGMINVEPLPDRGTRVVLTLPENGVNARPASAGALAS